MGDRTRLRARSRASESYRPIALAVIAALLIPVSAAAQRDPDADRASAPPEANEVSVAVAEARAAQAAGDAGRHVIALQVLLSAIERRDGPRSRSYAQASSLVGRALAAQARHREALPHLRAALDLFRTLETEPQAETIQAMDALARSSTAAGLHAEAEALFRPVYEAWRSRLGERDILTLAALNNLAFALRAQRRLDEALALFERLRTLADAAFGPNHEAALAARNGIAHTMHDQGRYREAEPLLREVLEGRRQLFGESHPEVIESRASLTRNLNDQGRLVDAEGLYRSEIELRSRTEGANAERVLFAINDLANNLMLQDRHDEAEPLLADALARQEAARGRSNGLYVSLLNNLIVARGDLSGGNLPVLEQSARLHQEVLGPEDPSTWISLSNLAFGLWNAGRPVEAERQFDEAVQGLQRVLGTGHPRTVYALENLTLVRLMLSDRGIELSGRAEAALTSARLTALSDPGSRLALEPSPSAQPARTDAVESRYSARRKLLADAAWAVLSRGAGDAESLRIEAFAAIQDATAGTTAQTLAVTAARHAAAGLSSELERLALRRQSLSETWLDRERRQTAALADMGPDGMQRRRQFQDELRSIEAELGAIDAVLSRDFPDYFSFIRPQALTVEAAAAMLEEDEAALLIVPSSFGTHVMAVTRDRGLQWHRAPLTADQAREFVAKLRRGLVCRPESCGAFDRHSAYRLYRELIEPIAASIARKRHLFIVADGPFASLPFGTLVTAAPEGSDAEPAALRATSWFADAHALSHLPSLQSLALQRRARRRDTLGRGFAGFGDPRLDARPTPPRSGAGDVRAADGRRLASPGALSALPRLAHAATELELLRAALGAPHSSVRVDNAATERAVRSTDFRETAVIAFATHGTLANQFGVDEPGLVFTPPAIPTAEDDGLLVPSEILGLRLDADWVILSACDTGAGDGRGGEALSGLARAFLYAGARSLLVSHWQVRDDVAPRISVQTVDLQRRNPTLSRALALQLAMRELRDDPDDPDLAHPASWAPFFLVGDGAR